MNTQENTSYLDLLQLIGLKLKRRADESIKELGLNAQQGKMIAYIHKHQGRGVIQKELADRFHVGGANITSILQGLEKKGFIERKIPAHNERQKNIYVLPKGVELIEEFERSFQQVEAEIVQTFSNEERKLLKELLLKINQNF